MIIRELITKLGFEADVRKVEVFDQAVDRLKLNLAGVVLSANAAAKAIGALGAQSAALRGITSASAGMAALTAAASTNAATAIGAGGAAALPATATATTAAITAQSTAQAKAATTRHALTMAEAQALRGLIGLNAAYRQQANELFTTKLKGYESSVQGFTSGLVGSVRNMAVAFGSIGAILAPAAIVSLADSYRLVQFRIKNATQSAEDYAEASKRISDISKQTGTALDDTAQVFYRIGVGLRGQLNNDELLKVTQTVQQLGALSGASKVALQAGLLQFGQAMSAGIVRAEEFNSVVENLPMLAETIAKGFGVSTGELRKMVLEGRVLSKDVAKILLQAFDDVNARAQEIPVSLDRVRNAGVIAFQEIIGRIEKTTGVTQKFVEWLQVGVDWLNNNQATVVTFFTDMYNGFNSLINFLGGFNVILKTTVDLFAAWIALKVLFFIAELIKLIQLARAAQITFNLAAYANPYFWIPIAIVALGLLVKAIWEAATGSENWLTTMFGWLDKVLGKVKELSTALYNLIPENLRNLDSAAANAIFGNKEGLLGQGPTPGATAANVSNDRTVTNNITINQTNNNEVTGTTASISAETRRNAEQAIKSAFPALANLSIGG